jgi:ferredoxin/flavodoxin---NADP+ reductase
VVVLPHDAELDPLSTEEMLKSSDRTAEQNVQTLMRYSIQTPQGKRVRIHMRFLVSPVELIGTERVEAIKIVKNELYRADDGTLRPRPTDETEIIPVGLVFRSIGYKGLALPGVPFDARNGVIPNAQGRVLNPEAHATVTGEYAVGWIKRGPSGIIGTNKPDSVETVRMMIEDLNEGRTLIPEQPTRAALDALLAERGVEIVTYPDWLLLDQHEQSIGQSEGRPRHKLSRVDEMLATLRQLKAAEPTGD